MPDAADRVRITQVATVFVPVADQDRALDFYLDELGFEKRSDFAYGDGIRWVEVAPRDSTIALALVPADEGEAENRDATHCALTSDDIEADTRRCAGRESMSTRLSRRRVPPDPD